VKEPPSLEGGLEHHRAGRLAEADAAYRGLLARDPGNVDALHFAGVVAYQRGRLEEAADLIAQALARNPSNAPAHNNLGNVLAAQGRLAAAIASYRSALALDPRYADARVNLAGKLSNLGGSLNDRGKPLEAAACCEEALALQPDLTEAHNNLGLALQALGRLSEGEQSFRRALELNPGMAPASVNLGFARLLQGDYAAGFALTEKRFAASAPVRALAAQFDPAARWDGAEAHGETLLVWTEQGLGDSIMMMRYLPMLKQRGFARTLVYCESALERLYQQTPGVDEVFSRKAPPPAGQFDRHCPVMSLPLAFGTRIESSPSEVPYLSVPRSLEKQWAAKLAGVAGRRVGLSWAGARLNARNALRSIRLEQLAPLFELDGVSLVNLQKGDGSEQLHQARWPILDRMDECRDLMDSAALIKQLDLVISVDTAVAHLAGALGKPVWLLNRCESEWRWMLEREDSPWYPTMRIFRQREPGDWDDVMARVAAALRQPQPPA